MGRRRRVEDICEAALLREEGDRAGFVAVACGDDTALRHEVGELLSHAKDAEQFLAMSIAAVAAEILADDGTRSGSGSLTRSALPSFEGRRVGQYDLIREIGRGGMGAVFEATRADNVFSNRVALKIVLPERSDAEVLSRFQREREIVAKLDHPNIARLFDGGTTDEGLPYSVMEFVDGKPIDVHCDDRGLNITDRLRLLRTVCSAVHYAHQHLVIHRDLKPSNILVTSDGRVKLLDFGIAKLLDDVHSQAALSDLTLGSRLLTLAYASPEQTRGARIATSTDVFSLGVILYELLTGRRPHFSKGVLPHQMNEATCEQSPTLPSEVVLESVDDSASRELVRLTPDQIGAVREGTVPKLARRLAGELDNIALMALRKEPDRRYRSVEQFDEDLGHHLSGLPVLAQRDSVGYRARKFIARHRVGVVTAAMVMLSMAGAVAATSWEARVARDERRRAERQAAEATLQSQRAEHQAREAEFFRQRAEHEAQFAKEQARVAEQQTHEADARRREAILEREKAERRARDVQTITAELLNLNSKVPSNPASIEAGKRAAGFAEHILLGLGADGFRDAALSQSVAAVQRLVSEYKDVDANISRAIPAGWLFDSDYPQDYEFGIDRKNAIAGSSAYIRSRGTQTQGSAELRQILHADSYRGKYIRLSAELKSVAVEDEAGVFARAFTFDGAVLDRSQGLVPLRGTNQWRHSEIVFAVPDDADEIAIGFALKGNGAVWADSFSFDVDRLKFPEFTLRGDSVIDADIPLTWVPARPVNLDFEDGPVPKR